MRARRAFTLVEVMVAIVVTGAIVLAVFGSLGAALDTRERLEERRLALRSQLAWRAMIGDALRNARPAAARGDTVFYLEDRIGRGGIPEDRVAFIAAGGQPPLTPDADWVIVLEASADGLRMLAAPLGVVAIPREIPAPQGLVGLEARVLSATGDGSGWVREWQRATALPEMVELTFWTDTGAAGEPLRIAFPLGGGRR